MNFLFRLIFLAAISWCSVSYTHGQVPNYVVTFLDSTLSFANGVAITNSGKVSGGISHEVNKPWAAFSWENGVMTIIEHPEALDGFVAMNSSNNSGMIVGHSAPTFPYSYTRAFSYDNGVYTDLGTLPNGNRSVASGVNDLGVIVGYSDTGDTFHGHSPFKGFTYSNAVMSAIEMFDGAHFNRARDINNQGIIVGDSLDMETFRSISYYYRDGQVHELDLLRDANYMSETRVINEQNQIGGYVRFNGIRQGFIYDIATDSATYLNPGDGREVLYVGDINNIGWSLTANIQLPNEGGDWDYTSMSTTLWIDGVGYDLEDLILDEIDFDSYYLVAPGINDDGYITGGLFSRETGEGRAFILTPVPEPSGAILCAFAALLSGLRRRR